jgi:hypothetical protein
MIKQANGSASRSRLAASDMTRTAQFALPGQNLAEAAGPVRDGAVADLATGDRQLGHGHRHHSQM